MLETNVKYVQVGAFCDDCNQCYPIFRNIENGTMIYENDDTGDLYVFNEINGSDSMMEVTTEAVIGLINSGYSKGLRGVVPFDDGRVLGIYNTGKDEYAYGIQTISQYYSGNIPQLESMDIEDYS